MKTVIIIPARYASSRFPGKPMISLLGKPMILWVAELSSKVVGKENVYVATEDTRISTIVEKAGFKTVMTSNDCLTGTDRLAEAASKIDADIFVNVQGDEPLIDPCDISKAIELKKANLDFIVNSYCLLTKKEDPNNVNIPKVITDEKNRLIYISRRAIPGVKDTEKGESLNYKKQVCIYAFTLEELKKFKDFGRKSELESFEDIEILRFLELGKKILMYESKSGSLAVDVPEDIEEVEKMLRKKHGL